MFPRGLLQEYASTLSLIARFIDIFCVLAAGALAYYWRFGNFNFPSHYEVAFLISALLTLIVFSTSGIYTSWRGKRWLHQARIVTMVWISVAIIMILISFLTKTSTVYSRIWMGTWVLTAWGFLLGFRLVFYKTLQYMRKKGWNHKRIIIVGTGDLARNVAKKIRESSWIGLDIVAFYDDDACAVTREIDGIDVKCGVNNLQSIVTNNRINEVWLALPLKEEERMKQILEDLRQSTVTIRFVPGIFGFRLFNHSLTEVAGLPIIDLNASPIVGVNRFIKELEDKVLSLLILIIISPIVLLIAIGVKLSSPGPVIFKQNRHGWDGRPIKVYKFRTMEVHEECEGQVTQACKYDVRVTKFGAFLRRTSLDELPQFFNVLQGRMSIVGPRPHAIEHSNQYKDQIDAYMLRHKVKPGITGWAQVNGWRGQTDTLEKMKKRVEYDLYYIENWTVWLDLKIIFMSLFTGFVHKNAY
jgi:putative colanic acid biosynthesis UDP-glucose lipid carrier transferase